MKKIKSFFETHPKLSYLGNLIVTFLGVTVFPLVFMDNFKGVILGFIIAMLITNICTGDLGILQKRAKLALF